MSYPPKKIAMDGHEYVLASEQQQATSVEGLPYCIIRADRAGVFAGYVESAAGQSYIVRNVRRLWYWSGAASCSELALSGVKKPKDCKFPASVSRQRIHGVIECLDATEVARKSIEGVSVWTA